MTARDVQFTVTPPFINPKNPTLGLDIPLVQKDFRRCHHLGFRSMIAVYGDLGETDVQYTVEVNYRSVMVASSPTSSFWISPPTWA